jgi:hypothetical protein
VRLREGDDRVEPFERVHALRGMDEPPDGLEIRPERRILACDRRGIEQVVLQRVRADCRTDDAAVRGGDVAQGRSRKGAFASARTGTAGSVRRTAPQAGPDDSHRIIVVVVDASAAVVGRDDGLGT